MSEKKLCARCGTKLYLNSLGEWFCVNCGILLDNNQEEINSEEIPAYIN